MTAEDIKTTHRHTRSRTSVRETKTRASAPERSLIQIVRRSVAPPMFRKKVLSTVRTIPKGKTLTYKEVATRAGNPKASRAVGAILRTNYDPAIPCHRVVKSDGTPGGYNRGARTKRRLLRAERADA